MGLNVAGSTNATSNSLYLTQNKFGKEGNTPILYNDWMLSLLIDSSSYDDQLGIPTSFRNGDKEISSNIDLVNCFFLLLFWKVIAKR